MGSILNGKKDENVNINGVNIERVESHKYLGKIIEEKFKGKEELKERIRKAKAATNEAFTLMNRKELNNKRISIGIKLLQTVVIPILTNGCETWTKLTEEEKLEVNQVQTQYFANQVFNPCRNRGGTRNSNNKGTNNRIFGTNSNIDNGILGFLGGFAAASVAQNAGLTSNCG